MCHLWPSSLLLIIEIFVLACMHEIFEENMFFRSLIIAHIYSDLHRAMEPGSTTPLWPVQTLIKAFARARSVISCHEQARPTPCRAPIMHGLCYRYWSTTTSTSTLNPFPCLHSWSGGRRFVSSSGKRTLLRTVVGRDQLEQL